MIDGWGIAGAQYGEFTCTTCHINNSTNIKRIKTGLTAPTDAFPGAAVNFLSTSGANSFGDDNRADKTQSNMICEVCHSKTSVHRYNSTGVADTNHMGANQGDCISCHQHNKGFSASCTSCHPTYPEPPATGAHLTHAGSTGYGYACSICHPVDHDGTPADITFSGVAATWAGATYSGAGTKQCSNLYCHGGATADWDAGTGGACGDCHGAAGTGRPDGANEPPGGSHLTTSHQVACTNCHSHDGTDKTEHVRGPANANGDALVSGAGTSIGGYAYGGAQHASSPDADGFRYTGGSCSTVTCHGNATWGGTGGCNFCHGGVDGSGNPQYWPDGTGSSYADSTVGAHDNHVLALAEHLYSITTLNALRADATTDAKQKAICAFCHPSPGGVNHHVDSGDSRVDLHGAGSFLTYDGAGASKTDTTSGAYSYANLNCSNLACHNQVATPSGASNWNTPPAPNCTTLCHPTGSYTNRHDTHVTTKGYACTQCHTSHGTDYRHGDGQVQLVWNNAGSFENTYGGGSVTYSQATPLSYKDATWGTCASAACHNNKTTPAWNAAATGNCTICHTAGGSNVDPISGIHAGTPTVSGVAHDDSFTNGTSTFGCATCHSSMPVTATSTHVDGANNGNTVANMGLNASMNYVQSAANVGTCFGSGNTGLTGCHNGSGDMGSWKRLWDANVSYKSDGTECKGCHGGFSETDWTFGSVSNTTDGSVEHNRNWDGDGNTGEVIGFHQNTTSNATKCNSCHVYNDTGYTYATMHRNGTLEMNNTVGYSETNWNCTSSCHAVNTSHNLENSNWTINLINGPALSCVTCHDNIYNSGAGTHIDADGPGTTYVASTPAGLCEACHNTGTGTIKGHWVLQGTAGTNRIGIPTIYSRSVNSSGEDTGALIPTMNKQYSTHDSYILLGGTATNSETSEAEMCWGCHDRVTTASYTIPAGTAVTISGGNTIAATGIGNKFGVGRWITIFDTGARPANQGRTFKVATSSANSITITIPTGAGVLTNVTNATTITIVSPVSEWQVNENTATGGVTYDYGMLFTNATAGSYTLSSNWTSATWRSGMGLNDTTAYNPFWYKAGTIQSTHSANYGGTKTAAITAGNSLGYGRTETKDAVGNIRCTYCHDVHGTHDGVNGDVAGRPYLRGSWKGNPYPEDGAPRSGMTNWTKAGGSVTNSLGAVPRGSASATNTGLTTVSKAGGFWIDQNSGNPNSGSSATATAGLCDQCHGSTKDGTWAAAEIGAIDEVTAENLWVSGYNGHAAVVIGGPGIGTLTAEKQGRNIFNRTWRGSTLVFNNQKMTDNPFVDMGLQSAKAGASDTGDRGYSFRGYGEGENMSLTPALEGSNRAYAFNAFQWNNRWGRSGIATGTINLIVSDGDTTGVADNTSPESEPAHDAQANYHTFSCSKCHNPHASRLPKLMITNCLDTKQNNWDDGFLPYDDSMSAANSYEPTAWNNTKASQWPSAQNCHRLDERAALTSGEAMSRGRGWNKVTPW